jgi:steroid 5-alpha reductase family enzyme
MKRFYLFLALSFLSALLALELASRGSPIAFVLEETPFTLILAICTGLAVSCLAFGAATGDYSWVDRLWSLAPILFAWIYAARAGFGSRSLIAAGLVTLWGARLTANFARRGGYSGMEDYRWSAIRGGISNPLLWQVFNALFICGFQLALMALFTSPLGRLAQGGGIGLGFLLAVALPLLFLAYETEADREQWSFQRRKEAYFAGRAGAAAGAGTGELDEEAERGFRSSGLFRLSRHPAYFGELGFWWSLYLLCALGSGGLVHWSAAGALCLSLLFVGSTRFTESLSLAKYPAYAEYRRGTSAIVPWFPARKASPEAAAGVIEP